MSRTRLMTLIPWLPALGLAFFGLVGCREPQGTEVADSREASNSGASTSAEAGQALSVANADPADAAAAESTDSDAGKEAASEEPVGEPQVYELDADKLLSAALPAEQLEDGWIRMFDGQSLFGWFMVGKADWRVQDGTLSVSRGERSYLCSSFELADYELKVDFRSDADSNSGVFLRCQPEPQDVGTECLELNIAPADNPFPTGSFVQRKKLDWEDLGEGFDPTEWHTYHVRLVGDQVEVRLDGKQVLEMEGFATAESGHISLQHNSGRVEFRNILLKPVEATDLKTGDDWEQDWTVAKKDDSVEFSVTSQEDGLRISGGLGQLQSKRDFGDFILQASYTLDQPEVNSGIFFRCIRDNMLDGYECQVNHAVIDGDPLRPADAGAGAIFRRQAARIVVGSGTEPSFLTVLAKGPHLLTWVNGVQVVDFVDTREPDENPRRGLRLEPGPLSIQGHDPTTQATYHSLRISELK